MKTSNKPEASASLFGDSQKPDPRDWLAAIIDGSDDAIVDRALAQFHAADTAYGHAVETAVKELRS